MKKDFKTKKGLGRYSEDCFYIDEYILNQYNWTEGFVTWDSNDDSWVE